MTDWNSKLYLKFEKERTQPAKDLINGIEMYRLHWVRPLQRQSIDCIPYLLRSVL